MIPDGHIIRIYKQILNYELNLYGGKVLEILNVLKRSILVIMTVLFVKIKDLQSIFFT